MEPKIEAEEVIKRLRQKIADIEYELLVAQIYIEQLLSIEKNPEEDS